jgi:chemotaxis protein MotB
MDGTSMLRRGGMAAGVVCLGLATMLGGCNKQNKQLELAQQEAAELREKNVELDTRLREKDTKIAELEGRLTQAAATPPATGGGWNTPRESYPAPRNFNQGSNETFTVSGDVLFDSGQTSLKPAAKKELDKIAAKIKSNHAGATVRVEGYTDSDPIRKSKWGTNEALSQARAESVASYLRSKGIGNISSIGMGSAKPKATKAASRRVEIVVSN